MFKVLASKNTCKGLQINIINKPIGLKTINKKAINKRIINIGTSDCFF